MRKRNHRMKRIPKGHVLTPKQVETLVMPIHVSLTLLPMGLFQEQHGHNLAAFVNVAQLAADEAGRDDIHQHAHGAAVILLRMRDRVRGGKGWNVTTAERDGLMKHITAIDGWMRGVSNVRWYRALNRVAAMCDRLLAEGKAEMDLVEVERGVAA